MNDSDWATGWRDLGLSYPQREEAEEVVASRAGLYRRHLDDLAPAAWLFAVETVIGSSRWFPTVAELREAAAAWRPEVAGYLPPSSKTEAELEAEREESREAARRGLEMIRAAYQESAKSLPPVPVVSLPEPAEVRVTEERLTELRRQAGEITADPATPEPSTPPGSTP